MSPPQTFILTLDDSKSNDNETNQEFFIETLNENLFLESELKEIISVALTVNGEDKAFIILSNKAKQKKYKSFVCDFNKIKYENNDIEGIGNYKWDKTCYLVRESGLALILPGNQRVKLIVKGHQIAEFCYGEWKVVNFRKMIEIITQITKKLELDERFLHDVLKKCIYASDIGTGLIFTIQRKDNILDRCHSGWKELKDLKENKIMEFKSEEYLNRAAKIDNAIILSKDGYTIAIGAPLKPKDTTEVQAIPGTGSRHLNAQRITKETDSIAFVVSKDGPITIFYEGKVEFRTP